MTEYYQHSDRGNLRFNVKTESYSFILGKEWYYFIRWFWYLFRAL